MTKTDKSNEEASFNYMKRGVSSSKKEVHAAISKVDKGIFPGAFCKIIPDVFTGDSSFCSIVHADGAGTKSSLAYLYYRETGDLSVFKGLAQDSIVMNIDDMLCVGVEDNILISSTIGRNANLIPGDIIAAVIEGGEEVIDFYNTHGVGMTSTGGETADVGDLVRTLIVDTTAAARLPRKDVIDCNRMKAGQKIVALSSYGQASYEDTYNAGMGSNGLTSARHDIFSHLYAGKYPESFDPAIPDKLVYNGRFKLTDTVEDMPVNMGLAVLSPTRTFAPVIKAVLQECRPLIGGIIHCTGGGQTKCLKFGNNLHYMKNDLLPVPPLFRYIQQSAGTSWKEMFSVFNMGHRMELMVDEKAVPIILQAAAKFKIEAKVIGYLQESREGNKLTIDSEMGRFEY